MSPFFRRATIILFLYSLFCVIAGIVVADGTLHPQRRAFGPAAIVEGEALARRTHSGISDVSILAADHIRLHAWLIKPESENGSVVLLFHGLSDNRLGMIGYAEFFLDHHYAVLMPDARAHGQSEGVLATYGLLESGDIRDWAVWVEQNVRPTCIYGLGESMGAAQLLQSLKGRTLFCAVAAESPFADLREIGYDRVGQFFHTKPWLGRTLLRPVIEASFVYSRWRYGLDLRGVSPQVAVMNSSIPVLLVHGEKDSNIPVRHSRMIKSVAPAVALWEVPHADHCGAITVAREEFFRRMLDWFRSIQHRDPSLPRKESRGSNLDRQLAIIPASKKILHLEQPQARSSKPTSGWAGSSAC